ncbi:MAG: PKD domain-containing protein [Cyclobacteriaceae bacterium]|nr:PKD domain-containing protein [Cyclobacteriaceae bacterium]
MRNLLNLVFLYSAIIVPINGFAQCGNLDVLIDNEACQSNAITILNNSVGISEFQYDFCVGDMGKIPSALLIDNYASIGRSDGVDIIREGNSYYGFLLASSGKLFRLDFGSSLANTPSVNDLGSIIGGFDISFIKDSNGIWHGYIAAGNSRIYRVDFDLGIESAISFVDLGNFGGIISSPRGIRTQKTGNDMYIYVTSSNLNTLSIIKFNGGVNGASTFRNIAITGGSQVVGIDLIKECNLTYVILSAVTNRKIYRVSLGSDVMDNLQTSIQEITSLAGVQTYELDILIEGSKTYLLLPAFAGTLYQANFGTTITNSPTLENRGNLGILDRILGSEFINDSSRVYGFTYNYITFDFSRVEYPNICDADLSYSESTTPTGVAYASSGKKYIEIKGFDNAGNTTVALDSISILDLPLTDFDIAKACLGQITEFTDMSSSTNGTVSNWAWDFDGLGTSNLQNPTFSFPLTGIYNISLTVDDPKGCAFTKVKTIEIYNANDISADFTYPSANCTKSAIQFTDASVYVEDVIQSWFWSFNGEGSSSEQDPSFTFELSGIKNITLSVTGLSGCTYSSTQQINVEVGPTTAFSFNNTCNGATTTFTDASTGNNLTTWNWDFGDGNFSTNQNPTHSYANAGKYVVSLTVGNNLGCTTTKVDTVYSHSIPVVNFTNDLPCSTSPIQFTDQSLVDNANMVAWEWDFGDGIISTEQHPSHLYNQTGNFTVNLKAYSQFGCFSTTQNIISVAQGPQVDFEWDKACEGEASTFTDLTNSFGIAIINWTWIIDGNLFTSQNPTYTFSNSGTYTVQLTVTGVNLCAQTLTQDIIVEVPPVVQFGYNEGCGSTGTTFYDTTTPSSDAVIAREWRVDGAVFSTDSVAATSLAPGNYNITLSVITSAGCEETTTTPVSLIGSPFANFEMPTTFGAAPLKIDFTNLSTGGNTYFWSFGDADNTTSTEQHPTFTFNKIGQYTVTLRTSSSPTCYDETTQLIEVVNPISSALIIAVSPLASNGKINFVVTIENTGTNSIDSTSNLVFRADYGTEVIEPINAIIYAGNTINYSASYAILSNSNTKNICVDIIDAANSQLDKSCVNINAAVNISEPYPNPTTGIFKVDVNLESGALIKIKIVNRSGQLVLTKSYEGKIGLNQLIIDGQVFPQGIYMVEVNAGGKTEQLKASVVR